MISYMKFFTSMLKKIVSKDIPNPIGRWRIEKCNKKTGAKIDLSNEDHCGPCGQYALEKIKVMDKNVVSNKKA
jgi:hypothetical protein